MYDKNITLLLERFPSLGLMVATLPEKEAAEEQIPFFEPGETEVLYIYGLGTGAAYFQYQTWLKGHPERRLVFLEDEPGIIGSFLKRKESFSILSDSQVHLELFSRKQKEIQALAERFPVERLELIALASKRNAKALRLKLLRATSLAHSLRIDRLYGYQHFGNFVANVGQIPQSFYANAFKGAFENVPAIICGAGPSLQKNIGVLKNLEEKALIIAGGSTLAALSSQGITPHFGMAIDPNLEEYRRFRNSFAFEVPLLYSTRVHSAIFQTCNGPFGYMRTGMGGMPELWMEEELGLTDRLMGDFLSSETISVTAICIIWAQFLGCNPILLNGIDMAYTGNRRYSAGVTEEGELAFEKRNTNEAVSNKIIRKKDRTGKFVHTAVRWVMESASISHFAKKHPHVQFINTTDGGIGFQGIDYLPIEEAAKGFQKLELRERIFRKIEESRMAERTKETVESKIDELKKSLVRVIDHLRVLAEEKKGSKALAELEIHDELAYSVLFYDVYQLFREDPHFWSKWLQLACKYELVLCQRVS